MDEAWGEGSPVSIAPLVGEEGMVMADDKEGVWYYSRMIYLHLAVGMEMEEAKASSQ